MVYERFQLCYSDLGNFIFHSLPTFAIVFFCVSDMTHGEESLYLIIMNMVYVYIQ